MRVLAFVSVAASLLAMTIMVALVISNAEVRGQLRSLDFPLDTLGKGTLIMVGPIVLSILAAVAGLLAWRRPVARLGLALAALCCAGIWLIVGTSGFAHLF